MVFSPLFSTQCLLLSISAVLCLHGALNRKQELYFPHQIMHGRNPSIYLFGENYSIQAFYIKLGIQGFPWANDKKQGLEIKRYSKKRNHICTWKSRNHTMLWNCAYEKYNMTLGSLGKSLFSLLFENYLYTMKATLGEHGMVCMFN